MNSSSFPKLFFSERAKLRDQFLQFSKKHKLVLICFTIFLIVSFVWEHGYVTDSEYPVISNSKIFDWLDPKTVPHLGIFAGQPACDYKQLIFDNKFVFTDFYLNGLLNSSNIRHGGEFIPFNCKTKFSTAILIPYRRRPKQFIMFLTYIHNFLRQQNIHYRIFVIEQADDKPFNRAKLFNVGAKYATEENFPCLIFHDVDLFPMKLGNLYACTKQPRHLAVNMDKHRFHLLYNGYFGGVISMKTEHFQQINGMSNVVS